MKVTGKRETQFADSAIWKFNENEKVKAGTTVETDLQIAVINMLHQSGVLADNVYFKVARKITEGV